jgi:hypothetical protein
MQATQDCVAIQTKATKVHDDMQKVFPEPVHQAVAQLSLLVAELAARVQALEDEHGGRPADDQL